MSTTDNLRALPASDLFAEMVIRVKTMNPVDVQAAINSSHPCEIATDAAYTADALAMALIHGRHDKREIVNMIRWVLMGCPSANVKAETRHE